MTTSKETEWMNHPRLRKLVTGMSSHEMKDAVSGAGQHTATYFVVRGVPRFRRRQDAFDVVHHDGH